MNTEFLNENKVKRKLSQQMHSVLTILNADDELMERVQPHVDLERDSIDWDQIFKQPWSSGERGALTWAFNLGRDEYRKGTNSFESALSMDPALQRAVLRALCIRWGIGNLG